MVFRDRPNSRAACRMLMPSTCTARLTRAYTSTWYTSWCPTKHKRPVMFWNRSGVVYFSTATNRRLRGALWSIIALPFRECSANFDLLLTDVVMPGLSGPDLTDHVLELNSSIRVLFMSACV